MSAIFEKSKKVYQTNLKILCAYHFDDQEYPVILFLAMSTERKFLSDSVRIAFLGLIRRTLFSSLENWNLQNAPPWGETIEVGKPHWVVLVMTMVL